MRSWGELWRGCCSAAKTREPENCCRTARGRRQKSGTTYQKRTQNIPPTDAQVVSSREAEGGRGGVGGAVETLVGQHTKHQPHSSTDRSKWHSKEGAKPRLRPGQLNLRSAYPEHIFEGDVSGVGVLELLLHRALHALPRRNRQNSTIQASRANNERLDLDERGGGSSRWFLKAVEFDGEVPLGIWNARVLRHD